MSLVLLKGNIVPVLVVSMEGPNALAFYPDQLDQSYTSRCYLRPMPYLSNYLSVFPSEMLQTDFVLFKTINKVKLKQAIVTKY